MKFAFILSAFLLISSNSLGQNTGISGTVVDYETGEPLVGATVKHITSGTEVITDFDGNFSIPEASNGTHQFSISYVSYNEAKLNRVIVKEGEDRSLTVKMRRTQNNTTASPALTLESTSNGLS